MKRAWFLAMAILLLAQLEMAWPCSCLPLSPPSKELKRADAVFWGKAIKVKPARITDGEEKVRGYLVTFAVARRFKGDLPSEVTVETGQGGGDCGVHFEAGKEYLVYAFGEGARLETNICTRTRECAAGDAELLQLEKYASASSGSSLKP